MIRIYYGKMGEVLKTVRTLIVPNQAVATYVTQWKYDSHNRLLEMIYPDEEKVTYGYNLGGQVDHVRGYKSYGYDYVNKIGYDKFEQRTYLKYCNGAETFYSYDPARRRLQNLVVNAKAGTIMDNAYSYDAVSNVLGVKNNAPLPQSGKAGGQMSHNYTYDPLYRLASATGTYRGTDNKSASYTLSMGYDNMHRITSKKQHLSQTGVQFDGTLNAGYDLTYTYGSAEGKKFQLDNVRDINYRTEETPTDSTNINNGHKYTYDLNGNLVYINTSRVKKDGKEDEKASEQKYRWDEENRLLAADENGFVSNYWYDADGERTVKTSGENEAIFVNSEFSGGNTGTARFSLYVSPYLVAGQGGKYTKHIYIGSQRIVSKLGDLASYGADPRRIPYAGNEADGLTINYKDKYNQQLQSIKDNYKTFDLPYNGKDNDDYVNGQGFCCNDGTPEAAQARVRTRTANGNFKPNDDYEKMQFYYHPDHLGSSSYITNLDGEVAQHIEYVPFGEVFIEERNNTWNTPYLFNAKEFDEETGMYYYGARYYEPRLGLWMSVDPISNYDPRNSENYLDGEHNGGVVNAQNLNPYQYCYQNPVRYNDPNGMQVDISVHGNTIELYQHLVFYGRQATSALSREISDNITYRFNKEKLTYSMNDRTYDVRLRTTYETVDIDKAIDMHSTNKNNEVQFIRISNVQKSSRHSIGANSGWFSTNDDLGNSTTPAHEMAHGLGLYHQDGTKNPPSIIIPRGTRVAAEWSNDKNPRKGVNPSIRRWTNGDIKKILDKASWDRGRTSGRIGKATNIIFNHDSSERTWTNVVKQFFGLEKP
ncbi:RHS repeat-associated core domain-containing protein [Prevotella brunnea]|uniref:RHS repeat-associated core domain-containing protein n=1 Tax=Prevotella brunnea TaxID=2508867 RepID=UPI00283AA0AD|nr:RHS repeat-associated core domain-containing protein [Prevotella brunnea]